MAKKKRTMRIDFSDTGGGRPRLPEGDYLATVASVKAETSQKGNKMLVWSFKIAEGKYEGKVIRTNTVLVKQSLFVLRNLLEAMGFDVPEKVVDVPIGEAKGKELAITLIDKEYNDRKYSEISDFSSSDVLDDEEDEEDEDEEEEEEDEEEEDEEEDDLEDVELDEL